MRAFKNSFNLTQKANFGKLAFEISYDKIQFMDSESKQLLQNTLALTEENNKLLHKIRGVQRRETIWNIVKILVIVAIAFGSFYYIEPYLNQLIGVYNGAKSNIDNFNSVLQNFKN
jgi:preprotein translocase subunit SecE